MDKAFPRKTRINFALGNELWMVADARGDHVYGKQVYGFQVNKSPHAFIPAVSDNVENVENDENRLHEAREPS